MFANIYCAECRKCVAFTEARKMAGDLRILGAVDGYAHAIVRLRQEIGSITYHGVNPRHTRKLAARESRLKSLRSIEAWLVDRHKETREAYKKTTR